MVLRVQRTRKDALFWATITSYCCSARVKTTMRVGQGWTTLVVGTAMMLTLRAGAEDTPPKSTDAKPLPTITQRTAGTQAMPGFFPCAWDAKEGKLWLEIGRFDTDFLYVESLAAGVGSNDIGLDRGQLGGSHVVRFTRVGPKVLLIERTCATGPSAMNADERAAVEQSFAQSVLWGFKVEAEENGSVLVDATPFLLHDAHGVADTLAETKAGDLQARRPRCAPYLPATRNFPRNTEFEATLTFTGKPEGDWIRSVTPDPGAVTVREHQSFVELPDERLSAARLRSAQRLLRGQATRTTPPRSRLRSSSVSSPGIACERRTRRRRAARRSNPSSTTSTPARLSRSDLPCSKARPGGTRRSRRLGTRMLSR